MKNASITIIIPAYNEEKNLEAAVRTTNEILKNRFMDYEILISDDCSYDKTGEIADMLAKKNSKIKVIHNKKNMGLGYSYRQGAKIAGKKYFSWVPGDNDVMSTSVKSVLEHVGETDIIIPYICNNQVRPLYRTIISSLFTHTLNLLFGLHLKSYTGIVVYKTELLKKVKMRTNSFAFQAEILIQLIKKGYSYKEVPMYTKWVGGSHMLRLKNLIGVLTTIIRLFFEINFGKNLKRTSG